MKRSLGFILVCLLVVVCLGFNGVVVVFGEPQTHKLDTANLYFWLEEGSGLFFEDDWIYLGDSTNGLWKYIDSDTIEFYNLKMDTGSCPDPWKINVTGPANCTVVRLFEGNVFEYNISASSSTVSVVTVGVSGYGEPVAVTGADSWEYNSTAETVEFTITHSSSYNVTADWNESNNVPTNDGCVSSSSFDVDVDGWVNMTVSDLDGVADLKTVDIEITGVDAKTFTLRWTQSTGVFSEVSDPDGVCTLNVGGSVRVNVDSDTDEICFLFKVSAGIQKGLCDVESTVVDDSDAQDVDSYVDEFTINFYGSVTVNTSTHSWTIDPGDSDVVINEGTISLTVTSNAVFDVQVKGDGDLEYGGESIGLGNVTVHKDTLGSAVSVTVSFADVGGLTGESMGVDLSKSFVLWLSVPVGKKPGGYEYILSVQIVES